MVQHTNSFHVCRTLAVFDEHGQPSINAMLLCQLLLGVSLEQAHMQLQQAARSRHSAQGSEPPSETSDDSEDESLQEERSQAKLPSDANLYLRVSMQDFLWLQ